MLTHRLLYINICKYLAVNYVGSTYSKLTLPQSGITLTCHIYICPCLLDGLLRYSYDATLDTLATMYIHTVYSSCMQCIKFDAKSVLLKQITNIRRSRDTVERILQPTVGNVMLSGMITKDVLPHSDLQKTRKIISL